MSILANYIKTITFYVVFINLIEMIMPNEKYAGFIRLFLGLVLMYIIIKPILFFDINNNALNIFESYENYIQVNSTNIDTNNIEETKQQLITSSYVLAKEEEIKSYIQAKTDYEVIDCIVSISTTENNYGELESIDLTVKANSDNFIEPIKPIEIGSNNNTKNVENDEVLELKKLILDVYNLSPNNININITK